MIDQTESLRNYIDVIAELDSEIENGSPETVKTSLKEVESSLSDLTGVSEIKTRLSKSRRALQGDNPDTIASKIYQQEAAKILASELQWREQAHSILLDDLHNYNDTIKNNIGIRLQQRFTKSQAKQIAACQSVHRDISLHF